MATLRKGILETLLNARSDSALKQQLLGDPLTVKREDIDPLEIDISDAHRTNMKNQLYKRQIIKSAIATDKEALSSRCNYADEELPKWCSTMKQEFTPKGIDLYSNTAARDCNNYT